MWFSLHQVYNKLQQLLYLFYNYLKLCTSQCDSPDKPRDSDRSIVAVRISPLPLMSLSESPPTHSFHCQKFPLSTHFTVRISSLIPISPIPLSVSHPSYPFHCHNPLPTQSFHCQNSLPPTHLTVRIPSLLPFHCQNPILILTLKCIFLLLIMSEHQITSLHNHHLKSLQGELWALSESPVWPVRD